MQMKEIENNGRLELHAKGNAFLHCLSVTLFLIANTMFLVERKVSNRFTVIYSSISLVKVANYDCASLKLNLFLFSLYN